MTEQPVERRLAAILAAEVAGYSQLIGAGEGATPTVGTRIAATHNRLTANARLDAPGTSLY